MFRCDWDLLWASRDGYPGKNRVEWVPAEVLFSLWVLGLGLAAFLFDSHDCPAGPPDDYLCSFKGPFFVLCPDHHVRMMMGPQGAGKGRQTLRRTSGIPLGVAILEPNSSSPMLNTSSKGEAAESEPELLTPFHQ